MNSFESTQAMLDDIDRQLENNLTLHFSKMAADRAAEQHKHNRIQIAVIYLTLWGISIGLTYTVYKVPLPMLIVSFVGVVTLITYRVLTVKRPAASRFLTGVAYEYRSMANRFWSSGGYGNRNPSAALKRHVMLRDGGRCRYCSSSHNLEFDHVRPWSKGGSTTAGNLQLLCRSCNRRKSNKW